MQSLWNLWKISNFCDFDDRAIWTFLHAACSKHIRELKDPTWIIPKVSTYLFVLRIYIQ